MQHPNVDERRLELKVGAMILVALALLVAFVLLLGDWSLKPKNEYNVFFQNPGGLSGGAAVKVAGRKIGVISEMTFLGQTGPRNPDSGLPSLVRVRMTVDRDAAETFRQDAKFYVTTKGVLGDPFLEIDPGVSPVPIDGKKPLFGLDPPRLDLFVADAYQLVKTINRLIDHNAQNLDQILGSGARLLTAADQWVDGGQGAGRMNRIADDLSSLIAESRTLVTSAKTKYVDDPKIDRILTNMESITAKLDKDIDPLITDIRTSLAAIDKLTGTIGEKEQAKIRSAVNKLDDIMTRADRAVKNVDDIMAQIRRGDGTVGQLLKDQEIYDDLKELIRDIKKHPWKIIWEE